MAPTAPIRSRVAFAAAHVVVDPLADSEAMDWDATLAYRRMLWCFGLGVAEAMDTAQRGMGLNWIRAQELIRRSVAEAHGVNGPIACGAGTDHLDAQVDAQAPHTLDEVIRAYEQQCEFVESCGGRIILMASRALAAIARTPDHYQHVYGRILRQTKEPVILHWLGDMFDPALSGYWGFRDAREAMRACLAVIEAHPGKVDGIKMSLLDASLEIEMRRQLPPGVRMYTGDDFGYADLILGGSDALLGIFDAIAPAASAALQALDRGDVEEYHRVLTPTVPLSRTIFENPTYNYKTGIVFLAWLNGYQRHFRMLGGKESARSVIHLSRVFMQAAGAELLIDPDLACQRMKLFLAQAGVY